MCEHPMIREIERNGFPLAVLQDDVFCEECGEDITDYEERYYDEKHEHLCERCLKFLHKKDW